MKGFVRFFFAVVTCLLCITGSNMASDQLPSLSEDFNGVPEDNWLQSGNDYLSQYIIDDDFDNGQLDPAWEINYDQASDWVYTEGGTKLTVTDIIKTTTNEGWTSVNLTRYLTSHLSDFNINFGFSWDSEGSTAAMQNVLIQGYSGGSKIIEVGYSDGWPASHGEQYGRIDGAGASNTGPDSLSSIGTASININRTSGLINVLWDDSPLISGTNSASIDRIDLVFSYYKENTNSSFFGNEAIDYIRVQDSSNADQPPSVHILTGASPHLSVNQGSHFLIYGTSGTNEISLESGARAELTNFPGYNQIHIASSSNLFTVSRSGTVVIFQGSDGTSLKIPATTSVQTVDFSDRMPMTLSIHGGQVMLDDQAVTTTPVLIENTNGESDTCSAYIAPGVWKEFDCYNLAAIGKTTNDDPFTPCWRLIGGYWQWGRKGPDPSQWYDTNTSNFAHGSIGTGLEGANEKEIREWDPISASDDAWSDSFKTTNDPCPEGFRVPSNSQWEGVLGNNTQNRVGTWSTTSDDHTNYTSALFLGGNLMLPAAGSRYFKSGALYDRGYFGHYWSSSESSSSLAWGLYFDSGRAFTYNYYPRLDGLSVRCISDSDDPYNMYNAQKIINNGFGNPNNTNVQAVSQFSGSLYLSTKNVSQGSQIWRSSDGGSNWMIVEDSRNGFGDPNNHEIFKLVEWNGSLYASTRNMETGTEIWASPNGTDWTQVNVDGFENQFTQKAREIIVYNDRLFVLASNYLTGCEVWASRDGTTWMQVNTSGFGDSNNTDAAAGYVFNGFLFCATEKEAGTTGIEIWRYDGSFWQKTASSGFGNPNNVYPTNMIAFDGFLYVGTENNLTIGEIWRSADGFQWERVGQISGTDYPPIFAPSLADNSQLYAWGSRFRNGVMDTLYYSIDGISWSPVLISPSGSYFNGAAIYALDESIYGFALTSAGLFNDVYRLTRTTSVGITEPDIAGSYGRGYYSNGIENNGEAEYISITFYPNDYYIFFQTDQTSDRCDFGGGVEYGTYTYDKNTRLLSVFPIVDENGCIGLSEYAAPTNIIADVTTSGVTVYDDNNDPEYTLERVVDEEAAIVGSWGQAHYVDYPGITSEYMSLTFYPNGHYFHWSSDTLDPGDFSGGEYGTYLYDEISQMLNINVTKDDNGNAGLSDGTGESSISNVRIENDRISLDGTEFMRVR